MSKTILCADDSVTMQKVAEITFEASEYDYAGARSADDALAQAKKQKPALILADAVMPGKTGYDLCRDIKADPALAGVPVIVMCGNSQAYDEAKGSEVGADGHVSKPWDTQKMLDQIGEFLEKAASGVAAPAGASATPAAKAVPDIPSKPAAKQPPSEAPRSSTLMGMPSLQMPPGGGKQTPGVTPIQPPSQAKAEAAKPAAKAKPAAAARPEKATTPAPVAAERAPMIKGQPSKPIRLVLASQVEQAAVRSAEGQGLDPAQAQALTDVSREVLERVVWEVVPELAEAIIRENLETLAAKAR